MPQDDKVQQRLQQLAQALGLRLDKITRAGSEGNMAGIQTDQILFSQRLDSRTYFVQDQRYGTDKALGSFGGNDQQFFQRGLEVLKALGVPVEEISDRSILAEQTQVAQFDANTGRATVEDPRPGNRKLLFTRQVRKLPVWSSNTVLGLTKDGQIGFLQLHWPEIPGAVVDQAQKLASMVQQGWRPPERPEATVEAVEAGIVHSPAAGFVMDIFPAIRVIYRPQDERIGRKPTLYFDADGKEVPVPRQFEKIDEPPTGPRKQGDQPPDEIARARANFKALLLGNENYFGNLPDSKLQPHLPIKLDTGFEEISCVGFEPQLQRLEATINIKQQTGYGGDICTSGTPEYVRFYLSFDNGATWVDQGMSSFTAYDIPGPKPLAYDVTLHITPFHQFCFRENIPLARAILSWNNPPPANTPGFTPIWGEVQDAHIQIAPRKLILVGDLFQELKVELPDNFKSLVDMELALPVPPPEELSVVQAHELYQKTDVPQHRYLFPEISKLMAVQSAPFVPGGPVLSNFKGALAGLNLDLASIIGKLIQTDGNTDFEELGCIGLNPTQDALVGVLTLKLPNGYSGGLCTAGSKEFVAFWIDFGSGFTYAGTTSVNVYDLNPLPPGGVQYAVFLPVDLSAHRQPCQKGPVTARVRAILSWQAQPPPGNPNYVPTWGNREEALIQIGPGEVADGQVPFLSAVGDIPESMIASTGKATGAAIHTGFVASDSPFGGVITIAGHISNPTSSMKYRVMRKPSGAPDSSYVPLTDEPIGLDLIVDTWSPIPGWQQNPVTVHADSQGYYPFEDYSPNHAVEGDIMMRWFSTAAEDGLAFDLRIDLSVDGNPAHDVHSNVVTVLIDNTPPDVSLDIDLGGGVQCADFNPGTVFNGHFSATDVHFGSFSFEIEPSGPPNFPAHGVLPAPASGASVHFGGAIADPGVAAGTYTLNTGINPGPPQTGPMDACGYSLTLHVWDRTNVNSGGGSYHSQASAGFCLSTPK